MNIRQLRYVYEIAKEGCNMSAAAKALHTSPSGVSKQLKLLESELGARLFHRKGSGLSGLTAAGESILDSATRVIHEVTRIASVGSQIRQRSTGRLVIGTTHTLACYVLPAVIKRFCSKYPLVDVIFRQADSKAIPTLIEKEEVDFGVMGYLNTDGESCVALECGQCERIVIVPNNHALLEKRKVTLKSLAEYPLITYDAGFSGREDVLKAFHSANLAPRIVLCASDADVIKSCVETGLGIAVVKSIVYDKRRDKGLKAMPASHLFPSDKFSVLFHRRRYFRDIDYSFIEMLAPRWAKSDIQKILK